MKIQVSVRRYIVKYGCSIMHTKCTCYSLERYLLYPLLLRRCHGGSGLGTCTTNVLLTKITLSMCSCMHVVSFCTLNIKLQVWKLNFAVGRGYFELYVVMGACTCNMYAYCSNSVQIKDCVT